MSGPERCNDHQPKTFRTVGKLQPKQKITLKFILQFFDKTDFGLVRRMMWLPSRNRLRAKNSQEAKKLKVRILNIPHHHQDSEVIYTWTHVKNAGNTCLIYFAWFNKAIFLSKNWAIKIGFFSPADIFFEKKILIVAKKTSNNFCCAPKTSVRFIFGAFDFGQKEEGKHSIKVKGSNRYCGIFLKSGLFLVRIFY